MLVSATEMINKAHEGITRSPPNSTSITIEWIKAILLGCEAKKSPVILCFGRCRKNMCG